MLALLARSSFDYRRVQSSAEMVHVDVVDLEPFGVGRLFVRTYLQSNPAGGGWLRLGARAVPSNGEAAVVFEPAVGAVVEAGGSSTSPTRRLAELNGELGPNLRLCVVATQDVRAQTIVVEVSAGLELDR